jgi:spermidine synthase
MKTASVIAWTLLASAAAPDGSPLTLWQRDQELVIRAGTVVLMSNRSHGSEELLAVHGCQGLGPRARVLVGGLGMGFTLRATLAAVGASAEVVVSELIPAVVEWARGPVGAASLLDDRRVTIDLRPVAAVIGEGKHAFDAILLDVDNGPTAQTVDDNKSLYDARGIGAIVSALRPNGRLAVWSAGEDDAYVRRLSRAGLDAQVVHARARRDRGPRHVIFVGVKRPR